MKKIPIIVTSILTLATTAISPIYALYREDDGTTWYTVDELFEYREELNDEMRQACGDDVWCQQEYYYNKMDVEPKVLALDQLTQQQFILTAVNPGEGYVKMLFFGEDTMLKHMGISEKIGIERVFVGWMENNSERIYSMSLDLDRYAGDIDGLHTIYAWGSDYEEDNLIVSDEEVMLEVGDLAENASGQLVYVIDSGYGKFNAVGRFAYASCLGELDYDNGAECRLMTSAEKGQTYFPLRTTNSDDDDNIDESDANKENDIFGNRADFVDDEQIANSEGQIDEGNIEENEVELDVNALVGTQNDERKEVKAPDTGTNTGPCNQKTIEFPWWLGGLIVLGDIVALWLFWPNRKKVQKNR